MITKADIAKLAHATRQIDRALQAVVAQLNALDIESLPATFDTNGNPVDENGNLWMPQGAAPAAQVPTNPQYAPNAAPGQGTAAPNPNTPTTAVNPTPKADEYFKDNPLIRDMVEDQRERQEAAETQRAEERDIKRGIHGRIAPYEVVIKECDRLPDGMPVIIVEDRNFNEWAPVPVDENFWNEMKDTLEQCPNEDFIYPLDNNEINTVRERWSPIAGAREDGTSKMSADPVEDQLIHKLQKGEITAEEFKQKMEEEKAYQQDIADMEAEEEGV